MVISDLKDSMVAVLGFGQEGKAVSDYLLQHGVKPVLFDEKAWDQWPENDREYIQSRELGVVFGSQCFKELAGFAVAFRSPGVRLSNPDIQFFVGKGLIITSQTKWFFEHCPAKIAGVTGTKGKGTTASLLFEIIKKQCQISNVQYQTYLTGNIGKVQPLEFLDALTPEDWVIYELSSFQLQDLDRSPHVGVALMITEEHLDYHADAPEYVRAKSAIAAFQGEKDFCIVNADFENSKAIGELSKGKKYFFSRRRELERGCFVGGDRVVIRDVEGNTFELPGSTFKLRGKHNWENICAAVAAALCCGAGQEACKEAVGSFAGLEHRLEFVAEKNGILFFNDSFSTTPEAAIAAVEAFTEPEVVILGGSTKHADFSSLIKTVMDSHVKAVVAIGEEGKKIAGELKASGYEGQLLDGGPDMERIMTQVLSVAEKGDVVLLSPACASFGMFKNYKDRGLQFKQAVERI